MNGDHRHTWELIIDVLDVLDKHGYHRADDQHTGRAVGLIGDLAHIYEGKQEAPTAAYAAAERWLAPQTGAEPPDPTAREDAVTVAATDMRTILAALDQASDYKHDRAETCADCADQSCGNCQFQLRMADTYDGLAARLLRAREATKPGPPAQQPALGGEPGNSARPQAPPEVEAGQ